MSDMNEPSIAELVRRVDDLLRSVERLHHTLEASYVRKEVFEARFDGLREAVRSSNRELVEDMADIKRVRETDANRWKQAMFAVGAQLLVLLIVGAVAVSNFMSRAGA